MKTTMMLIAGVMFLSPAFGNDSGYEERYKMKTGRYTSWEEARRVAQSKQDTPCVMGCCARQNAKSAAVSGAEARFRMKLGRSSPLEESRIAAARPAAPAAMCEHACCQHGL